MAGGARLLATRRGQLLVEEDVLAEQYERISVLRRRWRRAEAEDERASGHRRPAQ
jgi:hypothetical protein